MKKLLLILLCVPLIGLGQTEQTETDITISEIDTILYIYDSNRITVVTIHPPTNKVEEENKTGCILGECVDGKGTYTWDNGDKYVGEYKDNLRDGLGTYTWANGDKYVGEFKDGKSHGQGTLTNVDGTVEEGQWENDKFLGEE
jgi:hypothetical protein